MILTGLETLEETGHPWTDDSHSFSVTLPLPKRQAFFVRSTTGLSTPSMKLESDQSTSKSIHHRTLPMLVQETCFDGSGRDRELLVSMITTEAMVGLLVTFS
ncbi:hypothetical protein QYF36_021316 [Acer negundo]|nr:hypothetical protein QYF36_021316 [Acer negundo]